MPFSERGNVRRYKIWKMALKRQKLQFLVNNHNLVTGKEKVWTSDTIAMSPVAHVSSSLGKLTIMPSSTTVIDI